MTRGNNHQLLFHDYQDSGQYMKLFGKYKEELPFELYHYCLMPNHTHFLVKTAEADDFSLFMKKLNLSYWHYYSKRHGWVGHLWQDRYKSQPVGKDEYFIQCGKYIELNPVRAGLVKKPEEHLHTSYHYYAAGKPNLLITKNFIYGELGKTAKERQKAYVKMTISDIVTESYKERVWGSNKEQHNELTKIDYHFKRRLNY